MKKLLILLISAVFLAFGMGCGLFGGNHPPEIVDLSIIPASPHVGQAARVTCDAVDEDGDDLTYIFRSTGSAITSVSENVAIFVAPFRGDYILTCTVVDGRGGEDEARITVAVR